MMGGLDMRDYKSFFLALFFIGILGLVHSTVHAASCDTKKGGAAVASPDRVDLYSTTGSLDDLGTATITIAGFAYPVDDGCATKYTWGETTEFCWIASKDVNWITLNGSDTGIVRNTDGQGTLTIGINKSALEQYLNTLTTRPSIVTGTVTISTTLTDTPTIEIPVSVHLEPFVDQNCVTSQEGVLMASPSSLTFYVSAQDSEAPLPVNVKLEGMLYLEDPSNVTLAQRASFCWMASASRDWIHFVGDDDGILKGQGQEGNFTVAIDTSKLAIPQEVYLNGGSTTYEGNITIITNLSQSGEKTIPVMVYVNSLRTVEEDTVSTSQELSLPLNIPISSNLKGALYILVEHPRLFPHQVFAYRYDEENGARFDLFSERGHLVEGAGDLYYASDIQSVPAVSVPYSMYQSYPPEPYQNYDMPQVGSVNGTAPNIQGYLPVNIGEGIPLHGVEGDLIIRALVGDPDDVANWRIWKELLYKVVHVMPISGTWVVTDEINGRNYTYTDDDGNTYPLVLHEEDGVISGQWILADTTTNLTVQYLERPEGGYEIYFQEPSPLYGLVEYLYKIESIDTQGYIEGTWQYKLPGSNEWSAPERFTAVRQEVVVPLDRECNCYLVDGTVNGYPMRFYIDTGASHVFLDASYAQYMGVNLDDPAQCLEGTAIGVGGEVTVKYCQVDIEIEGRLSKTGVWAAFSDTWSGPGLLGMTFLDTFHVSKSSDGTIILAP